MTETYRTTVKYEFIRGSTREERTYTFDHVSVPPLSTGRTIEDVFRKSIGRSTTDLVKRVLTDLYRFLVFSNYAKFDDNHGERSESLKELNSQYSYAGKMVEAQSFGASNHQSQSTNTLGAVVYLLMNSKNSKETNQVLGGILVAMLSHKKFTKPSRIDAEM